MTYLIFKIIVYLAAAMLLGGALGGYIRHVFARRELEQMGRTMREAQSLVPKFETNIQSRDQRIEKLKRDIAKWQEKYPALARKLDQRETTIRERDRKIHQLESQLAVARLSDSVQVPVPAPAPAPLDAAEARAEQQRFAALAEELEDQQQRFKDLARVMDDQTRQIEDLTVERERQEKSLAKLNEQLEMAQQTNVNLANNLQHSRDALRDARTESERLRADLPEPPAPEPAGVRPAQLSLPSRPPQKRRKVTPYPRVMRGHRG